MFCKYTRHAHLQRTMEELTCSSASLGFCPRYLKRFLSLPLFHLRFSTFVAYLITPPSCFTFISPVFFDSNAAKAFLNLKILSSGMKSAILTPSNRGIYKCENFWFWNLFRIQSVSCQRMQNYVMPLNRYIQATFCFWQSSTSQCHSG